MPTGIGYSGILVCDQNGGQQVPTLRRMSYLQAAVGG